MRILAEVKEDLQVDLNEYVQMFTLAEYMYFLTNLLISLGKIPLIAKYQGCDSLVP